ncbi:MAG: PAS domain S-box protein, partial [Anaerolineales bacterium]
SNQSNGAYEQDLRIIRPDGQERWISSRGNVIYEEVSGEKHAARMVGIVMDITQQKQAEKELEESQIQYQRLIETMNEGLGIVDKNLIFMYANPRLAEMLGYRQDEIIGKHLQVFFSQENYNIVINQFEKRKKGGEQPYTVTWQCKDGSELHSLVAPAAVLDENNELLRSIAVVSDISEQIETQQLLDTRMQERTREISSLMEVSRIIVSSLAFEEQLKIILQNLKRVVQYNGASVILSDENELITDSFQQQIPEELTEKLLAPFMQSDHFDSQFWKGEALILPNIRGQSQPERDFYRLTESLFGSVPADMVAWIGIPITSRNKLIGVLQVLHNIPGRYFGSLDR